MKENKNFDAAFGLNFHVAVHKMKLPPNLRHGGEGQWLKFVVYGDLFN